MTNSKRERILTTAEVAQLLQVTVSSIVKWSDDGLLHAYRTPGAHRRFRTSDVVAFLRNTGGWIPPELMTGRCRVLFVATNGHLLAAMQRAARPLAARIDFSTSQSQVDAILRLATDKPDILLLDDEPSLRPIEVARQLKANPETAGIGVVILSHRPSPDLIRQAQAAGASVRSKPQSAEDLLGMVGLSASAAR